MKYVSKRFFIASVAASVAAMMAVASVLAGCGSSEGTDETKVVTETQIVTRVVNGVFTDEEGNILRDEKGEPISAPAGTPDTEEKEKSESSADGKSSDSKSSDSKSSDSKSSENKSSENKSSDSKSSDSKSSDNKSSDSKSSDSKSSDKKDNAGSGTLKVGGKTFNVGDTITCTYSVTSPDAFINFQATLNYDSSVLKATNAKMLGEAKSGSVINYKLDGQVKFNGIFLGGYDYSDGGQFMSVTYDVVGAGSASPAITWEVVTDESNKAMVVNGDIRSSFKVSESYE